MSNPAWFGKVYEAPCCNEETFIHESAYVDEPAIIGHGTHIMHFTHVSAHAVLGSHCQIGQNVTIAPGVLIGNNVRVLNNSMLSSGVILEDEVYLGPGTVFTPLKYIRGEVSNVSTLQPTLVKRGASVGANTTIAVGHIVGQYAFVESNSVIDRNIPDFALVYGSPVQFAGWRCECGQVLKFTIADTTACTRCNLKYARRTETEIVQLSHGSPRHDSHIQSRSAIQHFEGFH